jgi:hypothetical protein
MVVLCVADLAAELCFLGGMGGTCHVSRSRSKGISDGMNGKTSNLFELLIFFALF